MRIDWAVGRSETEGKAFICTRAGGMVEIWRWELPVLVMALQELDDQWEMISSDR